MLCVQSEGEMGAKYKNVRGLYINWYHLDSRSFSPELQLVLFRLTPRLEIDFSKCWQAIFIRQKGVLPSGKCQNPVNLTEAHICCTKEIHLITSAALWRVSNQGSCRASTVRTLKQTSTGTMQSSHCIWHDGKCPVSARHGSRKHADVGLGLH